VVGSRCRCENLPFLPAGDERGHVVRSGWWHLGMYRMGTKTSALALVGLRFGGGPLGRRFGFGICDPCRFMRACGRCKQWCCFGLAIHESVIA